MSTEGILTGWNVNEIFALSRDNKNAGVIASQRIERIHENSKQFQNGGLCAISRCF